jgi:hypothetical protein
MATGGGEEDAFRRSGLDHTPQEELLTPGRAELVRLARAKSAWDQWLCERLYFKGLL